MFQIDDDMTIYITRGDVACFTVTAENNGEKYMFQPGDVVRIKVFAKKDAANVAFQKDFPVLEVSEKVDILLTEKETKIGDVISKPVDYWYEIELNPYSNPQTIIGYDEDGAKIFKVYPEGRDLGNETESEDVPVVDTELSLVSQKPVENQAITAAMVRLSNEIATERGRISKLANGEEVTDTYAAEVANVRIGIDGKIYTSAGNAVREQLSKEIKRAIAREDELEELFTTPTQAAVNNWLDEHPEATTTVQDNSITIEKMQLGTLSYITPQMYGAIGNGTTDDTEAIKTALDFCMTHGRSLYFPKGRYKLTENLEITKYVVLYGDNENSVIETGNFTAITANTECIIKDLKIQCTETATEGTYGILVKRTNFVELRNLHIVDYYDNILFDESCFYCTVSHMKFTGCVNSFIRTRGTTAAGHQIIFNNITIASDHGKYGFYLENIGAITMNEIELSPYKLTESSLYIGKMAELAGVSQFTNVRFEGCSETCFVTDESVHKYLYFNNVYFYGKIDVKQLKDCYFNNCHFTGMSPLTFTDCENVNAVNCEFVVNANEIVQLNNSTIKLSKCNYNGTFVFVHAYDNNCEMWVNDSNVGNSPTPLYSTDFSKVHVKGCLTANYSLNKFVVGIGRNGNQVVFNTGFTIPPANYAIIPVNQYAYNMDISHLSTEGASIIANCTNAITDGELYLAYVIATTD